MVNKAIIVGNLGRDPEVRFTPSGRAVAKFSVATTEKLDRSAGPAAGKDRVAQHRRVGEAGGDLRPVPLEGPAGVRRGPHHQPQLRRQGRQQELHHRDHRARRALPRRRRRRRRGWRRGATAASRRRRARTDRRRKTTSRSEATIGAAPAAAAPANGGAAHQRHLGERRLPCCRAARADRREPGAHGDRGRARSRRPARVRRGSLRPPRRPAARARAKYRRARCASPAALAVLRARARRSRAPLDLVVGPGGSRLAGSRSARKLGQQRRREVGRRLVDGHRSRRRRHHPSPTEADGAAPGRPQHLGVLAAHQVDHGRPLEAAPRPPARPRREAGRSRRRVARSPRLHAAARSRRRSSRRRRRRRRPTRPARTGAGAAGRPEVEPVGGTDDEATARARVARRRRGRRREGGEEKTAAGDMPPTKPLTAAVLKNAEYRCGAAVHRARCSALEMRASRTALPDGELDAVQCSKPGLPGARAARPQL